MTAKEVYNALDNYYMSRAYYCVHNTYCFHHLYKETDLEPYQGLIYVLKSGEIKKIKEAKFLHKEIINIEPVLCRKFYYSYLKLKNNYN